MATPGTVGAAHFEGPQLKARRELHEITSAPGPVVITSKLAKIMFVNLSWMEYVGPDEISVLSAEISTTGTAVTVYNTAGLTRRVSVELIGM